MSHNRVVVQINWFIGSDGLLTGPRGIGSEELVHFGRGQKRRLGIEDL